MRLVFAHVDRVVVEREERVLPASLAADAGASGSVRAEDALVVFATVESGDGVDESGVVSGAASAVREVADRLRVETVVLYPETVSSARPAGASAAAPVFDGVVDALADASFAVVPAWFGWRRRLDVAVKAHPFATDARTVRPGDDASDEPAEPPSWAVVDADGSRVDPGTFLASRSPSRGVERALRAVATSLDDPPNAVETASGERPPDRAARARALGVADRDPLADGVRWRPVGAFLRSSIADAVADAVPADAMPVGGPRAVDLADEPVRAYAAAFGARGHGVVVDDERVFPDAYGCVNAFETLADADVDADDGPVSVFDADATAPPVDAASPGRTPWSTDAPSAVAVPGSDTAPTVHTAVADVDAAHGVALDRARSALALADACGVDAVVCCRATPSFHAAHADWFDDLASALDAPTLVAETDAAAPWSLRADVVTATASGRALATGTVGVDPESARRFQSGTDAPALVHAAPAGALAATVAAVVDAAADSTDPTPLPAWLAPTQVRLLPVAADHVERCEAVADELADASVRVDVDDRERTVGERIRRAARDRVPHYVVVGDDERGDDPLPVTDSESGRERSLSVAALATNVADAVDGRPHRERPLPGRLSARLRFVDD